MNDGEHPNPIVRFFAWWNDAMRTPDALTPQAFGTHFTEEARLTVNADLRATGPAQMVPHYRAIAARFDTVEMRLPVEAALCDADSAFVHCWTRATKGDAEHLEEAMAHARLNRGRMETLTVIGRPRQDA